MDAVGYTVPVYDMERTSCALLRGRRQSWMRNCVWERCLPPEIGAMMGQRPLGSPENKK